MLEAILSIEVYEAIKGKLGEEGAKKLLQYIGGVGIKNEVATKADLEKVKAEVEKVKAEMATKTDLEKVKVEVEKVKIDVEKIKVEMATKVDLEKVRADLLKWMFLFWIGQVAVLIGILSVAKVF